MKKIRHMGLGVIAVMDDEEYAAHQRWSLKFNLIAIPVTIGFFALGIHWLSGLGGCA